MHQLIDPCSWDFKGKPVPVRSSSSGNASSNVSLNVESEFFSMQGELFEIVEKLQKLNKRNIGENHRLEDTFAHTVFDLSSSVFLNYEVKVLERGLDFALTQQKINESELRKDFHLFSRRM